MPKATKKTKGGQTKTDPSSSSSSGKAKTDRKAKGGIAQGSIEYSSNGKVKNKTGPSHESAVTSRKSPKTTGTNGMSGELQHLMEVRDQERHERESITLFKKPITTLHYFLLELCLEIHEYALKLWEYKLSVLIMLAMILASMVAYHSPGPHQEMVQSIEKQVLWCLYWLGLGVLSSVGLGTGLHTFLLYLGPHIAAVTLAAYECGTTDFPSPPYPDSIVCPDDETPGHVSLWSIMSKVRLEAMMWGAGTALGELPPYFVARTSRLSSLGKGKRGRRPSIELAEEDKLAEFEALQLKQQHPEQLNLVDRLKLGVEQLVERVGFLGILACASIPNPLFDLAGITCGHFLVPFWTFFGATLIGKAIIKTHLQQVTVIIAFSENLVNTLVTGLAKVPVIGHHLQEPIEQLLKTQKAKLHSKGGKETSEGGSVLASLFEKLVLIMVIYFVVSIVNSLAQSYHQRQQTKKHNLEAATPRSGGRQRRKSQSGAKQA